MDAGKIVGPRDHGSNPVGPLREGGLDPWGVSATALALFGLTLGCATQEEKYRVRLENTGEPALHAVHSERLAEIMKRLDSLMFERQRTQVSIAEDRRRLAKEAKGVAEELLSSVRYVASLADELGLSPSEEEIHLSLVGELERQARDLAVLAEGREAAALTAQYDQITTTCNACHSSFRDQRGSKR